MYPPGSAYKSAGGGSSGGPLPASCPSEWPTKTGYLTQGAYSPPDCSHSSLEAIDIGKQGK